MTFLTDNHIHSTISTDAHNTMTEMALASYEKGVRALCFTDHCDLDHFKTGIPDPQCFDMRDEMNEMFAQAKRAVPSDMELFLGLELGEGNHDVDRMREIASSPELDFILGSLHNLSGEKDFYEMEFPDSAYCREVLERYMDELIELAALPYFDVMAHIGYPVRYMRRRCDPQMKFGMRDYGDRLDVLLKILIQNGKGLEINCSGLRDEYMLETMPETEVLRRYRELGGEIITVGSDAHRVSDAGSYLRDGFEILRNLNYKYVTIFRNRKPEFIKL